jgi:hypothetical protein
MSSLKIASIATALAAATWVGACNSDAPEQNPSFSVGGTSAHAGAAPGTEEGGEPSSIGTAARPAGGTKATAGTGSADPETAAGAGGVEPEQPPYDCVLHPTTHLEIINACTDALRIDKHPSLPALPQ